MTWADITDDRCIRRHERRDEPGRARVEKAQAGDAAIARMRGDGRDPFVHAAGALPLVVHDDRYVMAEIAPGTGQQHVLDGLAADVLGIALARQHAVRVETHDADASRAQGRPPLLAQP